MQDDVRRFRHEALLYGTDDELVAAAVPFLREGVDAGDATVVALRGREQRLLLDALGPAHGVTPLAWETMYPNPFAALEAHHRMVGDRLREGAARVRAVGAVPVGRTSAERDGWIAYEAVLNHLLGARELWSMCPYDVRVTPDDVLADVERTHTHLAAPEGGHAPSESYVGPARFLADRARASADPLEAEAPHVAERDPTPSEARRIVGDLAAVTALDIATIDGLVLAVSEVVTNAVMHGEAPVDVRAWAATDRVVVTVRDRGPGPDDPFVGFLPRNEGLGGLGLWMSNQATSRLALVREPDGFTVRLTAELGPDGDAAPSP